MGWGQDEIIFVSLASYDGRKNQLGLLTAFDQAAGRFAQARLVCAGGVADVAYYEAVLAHAGSLRTKNRITLWKHRSDAPTILSASDFFILNSFFEGWSVAATEALLMGLPLIHSDCGSAAELVGQGQNRRGVVVPNPAADPLDLDWPLVAREMAQQMHVNTDRPGAGHPGYAG